MMKNLPYDRDVRVAEEIYRVISESLLNDLTDPRLLNLRVTRVRMTKDLKTARTYFHIEGSNSTVREKAKKGLQSARGYLKRKICEHMTLKFTPELEFFYDESVDLMNTIDKLFEGRELHDQED